MGWFLRTSLRVGPLDRSPSIKKANALDELARKIEVDVPTFLSGEGTMLGPALITGRVAGGLGGPRGRLRARLHRSSQPAAVSVSCSSSPYNSTV